MAFWCPKCLKPPRANPARPVSKRKWGCDGVREFCFCYNALSCALQTSLHWNDEKKNEIRQIEQRMIKNRSLNGAGLFIQIALRHAEEEKGNEG